VGKSITFIVDPQEEKEEQERMLQVLETGSWRGQYVQRRKDGKTFWADAAVSLVTDQNGRPWGMIGIDRDISNRKQTEEEMVRLERLGALGEMAQGVAHNFNNLLVGVLGYAQIIQLKTEDPEISKDMEHIVQSALRAKELVERISRAVQGEKDSTMHPVPVNRVVQEAVQSTRPRWKDEPEAKGISIEVVTELEEVPHVGGTEDRLRDILTNLMFNAVDAMPEGGTMTIRTEAVGDRVQITVRDTGIGMDEETRRRVFEPFFTTKADIGTGLGLSTVYNTLTRWGGSIEVGSSPGKGAAFTFRLPAWTGSMQGEDEDGEVGQVRGGKILVVEDEEVVRLLLADLLSEDHEVVAVSSGREAMERFAPGRYDVALIDLGMPEMPGNQVAEKMREADPLLVTVLVTGWNLEEDDPRLKAFDLRILKPFAALEKVLDVVGRGLALHDTRVEDGE
jgi:signal transduction histidine kinase/CheY-like chemotaxis protein